MAAPGRKSWVEEMELGRRYSRLTEPVFKVIDEMLNSDDKADRKWAVEQMQKAFVKMIPQDVTSDGKALPTPIISLDKYVRGDDSTGEDSPSQ